MRVRAVSRALLVCVAWALLLSRPAVMAPAQAAQAAQGMIEGTVKSAAGRPLPAAKLTLKLNGGETVLAAASGENGSFRLGPAPVGVYTLEVRHGGYSDVTRKAVVIAGAGTLTLNVVLKPLPSPNARSSTSLGKIKFYQSSRFETEQLKDPAAGGGYSDSASVEGARMVGQYLIPSPSPPSPSSLGASRSATASASVDSAGAEMLARRDFSHAAAWFRSSLAHHPQSARGQMGLGISLYGQGEYEAAVEALRKAALLSPDDPAPELLLAEAARFAPSHQPEVAALLLRFTKAHPGNADGHYAYAMDLWAIFRRQRNHAVLTQARAESERAVALAPGNAAVHFQLGILYDEERMTAQAIRQYREALHLNPDFSTAHYRLAQDLFRSGAKNEAESEMDAYEKLQEKGAR